MRQKLNDIMCTLIAPPWPQHNLHTYYITSIKFSYRKKFYNCLTYSDIKYCLLVYVITSVYVSFVVACAGLAGKVGQHVYCSADDSCLAITCCANLKVFIYRHALPASISYDPCAKTLTMDVGGISKVINIPSVGDFGRFIITVFTLCCSIFEKLNQLQYFWFI